MHLDLPVSQEILTAIARLDHFRGKWSGPQALSKDRLIRLQEAARIQSTAASCRLAGIRVTDGEVAALLHGEETTHRDSRELAGYASALSEPLAHGAGLVDSAELRRVHRLMLGSADPAEPLSAWRRQPLIREAFTDDGKATGLIFSTVPSRLVEEKTEELLTWLEYELRSGEQHPVLVVGGFTLCLLVASPFERGNGRLARLLLTRLLRRVGYEHLPYASVEAQMEQLRGEYYRSFAQAESRIWTEDFDPEPWLRYLVEVLERHRRRVEAKIELERDASAYPPLQRRILETVREHGNVDAALLIKATGANRNTLKDNLRRMVLRGVLEKTGQRRGTRYRLATGARPAGEVLER